MLSVQKIKAFQKRNVFSRMLEGGFKRVVGLITSNVNVLKQVPEASRNLEMMVEYLLRFGITSPGKLGTILATAADWQIKYYNAQLEAKNKPAYLVYTAADHLIPFKPEEDTMYAYMIAQVAYVAYKISRLLSRRHLIYIAGCFQELNRIAAEVYRQYPTRMPRFTKHDRVSLSVVQWLDKPLNCCPSLHIAYSTLLYNIGRNVLSLHDKDKEAWESIENSTYGMINSVLYTKQHALVDVAFGILAAQIIFERRFRNQTFDNLMDVLPALQKAHPDIPYTLVSKAYDEADVLRNEHKELSSIVGEYLNQKKFPLIKPNAPQGYYDLEKQAFVPILKDKSFYTE